MRKIAKNMRTMLLTALIAAGASHLFAGEMDNGESYFLQKQYWRAIECYRRALDAKLNDNNRAICWYMVGRSYLQLGRYDDAKISFMNIVNLYEKTDWLPEAYVGLGDLEFKRNKFSEALKYYRSSQTESFMKRSGSKVLLKMAKTQKHLGNSKEASNLESRIRKEYPNSLEARLLMKGTSGKTVTAAAQQGSKSAATASTPKQSGSSVKSTTSSAPKTKFAVQVSYTPKQNLANEYAAKLKKKGYKAYVRKGSKGYSVLVGDYASKSEAQSVCAKLRKSEKNDSYVISL